jgi:hypothetical protein
VIDPGNSKDEARQDAWGLQAGSSQKQLQIPPLLAVGRNDNSWICEMVPLHIGVAGAHGLVELRLGEVERCITRGFVLGGARHELWSSSGVFSTQRH